MLTSRRRAFVLSVFEEVSSFFDVQGQCRNRDFNAIVEDLADTSMNGSIEEAALSREAISCLCSPTPSECRRGKGLLREECGGTASLSILEWLSVPLAEQVDHCYIPDKLGCVPQRLHSCAYFHPIQQVCLLGHQILALIP